MKTKAFLFAFQAFALSAMHAAFAAETLTVQGTIRSTKGEVLTGRQTVECRLYSQGDGGTALWGAAVATLLDANGVFTIELRDDAGSKLVDSRLGDVLKSTEKGELWLGVAVNGGGEMKPRQEIVSVPFAMVGLDASSAADFSVSGTARVDRVEVADPGHADGDFDAVSAGSVLFQRDFAVEGGASVEGGVSVSGRLEASNGVEAGKVSASGGFFGAGAVPVGAIMPWWGAKDELPEGWTICDGNNGMPDLKGRFLYGCRLGDAGGVGGQQSVKLNDDQVPSHSHTVDLHDSNTKSYGWGWLDDDNDQEDFWQGKDVGGTSTSPNLGGGKDHNNLPPYRMLYFIQRTK